jgi:hypothetical protein
MLKDLAKLKQERPSTEKNLPMPKYEYQKPTNGSYSFGVDTRGVDQKPSAPKLVGLQNLKFV